MLISVIYHKEGKKMKKVRNTLMILWTLFAVSSPAIMGKYSSDNIIFAVIVEIFGIVVLAVVFGIIGLIASKVGGHASQDSPEELTPVEKPVRVLKLRVISGKESFGLPSRKTPFLLRQWKDGYVTIADMPEKYTLMDYEWNGPEYRTVEKTTTTSHTKGKSKEKTKRRGHLAGAVIGTAIAPGVGTIVGAAVGTGKKTKGKNNSITTGTATTTSDNIEVDSYASMKMRNVETNQVNTIGFYCSSNIDMQLKSFNISQSSDIVENVRNQKTSVELLKDYKELLDSGIITQEEFEQKKIELL